MLGPSPAPGAVAELEAEVRAALATYQAEVTTGAIGRGPLLVRGRPIADYLDLDTVARLLACRGPQ